MKNKLFLILIATAAILKLITISAHAQNPKGTVHLVIKSDDGTNIDTTFDYSPHFRHQIETIAQQNGLPPQPRHVWHQQINAPNDSIRKRIEIMVDENMMMGNPPFMDDDMVRVFTNGEDSAIFNQLGFGPDSMFTFFMRRPMHCPPPMFGDDVFMMPPPPFGHDSTMAFFFNDTCTQRIFCNPCPKGKIGMATWSDSCMNFSFDFDTANFQKEVIVKHLSIDENGNVISDDPTRKVIFGGRPGGRVIEINDQQGNIEWNTNDQGNVVIELDGDQIKGKQVIVKIVDCDIDIKHDKKQRKTSKKQQQAQQMKQDIQMPAQINFYPNPNNGLFTVEFDQDRPQTIEVEVFDITGKKVYSDRVRRFSGHYRQEINLGQQREGIYMLRVKQGNTVTTQKVVVKE